MARVALINQAGVAPERLGLIVEAADLPPGEVRLIVGDRKLSSDLQGACIARSFIRFAGNIYGLEDHLRQPWDCGVSIGSRWSDAEADFPAYFAYLLGHELGHASTVLSNITLTLYEDLLLRYVHKASGRGVWRYDEMPHEVRYDRFGKAVVEKVFGPGVLEEEIHVIRDRGLTDDEPRLEKLLSLEPDLDLKDLRKDLAEFARPYRTEYLRLWEEDRASGVLEIAAGLDFEWLWASSDDTESGEADLPLSGNGT